MPDKFSDIGLHCGITITFPRAFCPNTRSNEPTVTAPVRGFLNLRDVHDLYSSCRWQTPCLESESMSLFQTILASIENPQHSGSTADLAGLANLTQFIPGGGANLQPILGVLGQHVQEALQEKQQNEGQAAAQQTVANLSQGQNVDVNQIQNFLGADRFNGLVGDIAQKTGINSQLIIEFIPVLIPMVMRLLATGNHQTDAQAPNPVLSQFLGGNQGGGAMLGEAFQLASQFLRR
jgi:hypothetical protein